jgi:hypothetical protein
MTTTKWLVALAAAALALVPAALAKVGDVIR